MGKSYAEKMNNIKTMIAGIKAHQEKLSRRGIDGDFTNNFEQNYNAAEKLDNEQEKTKSLLATKTEELGKKVELLDKLHAEAKKMVKQDFDKTAWKEFGIQDKQ